MDYRVENSLTIKLEGDEVNDFIDWIDKSYREVKRPGYKKLFPKNTHPLITELHDEFIGDENTDQD